jgi:hypothetical protein
MSLEKFPKWMASGLILFWYDNSAIGLERKCLKMMIGKLQL